MTSPERSDAALRVSLDLWYPECWEIEITERLDVGILGYGIYATGGEVATLFTIYANDQASVTEGVAAIRASEHVHTVSQMASGFRQASVPKPGNATRELLVVHDGRKQISQPLTSRGFVCTGPIDIRGGREYWNLATNHDRETVRVKLDEVREQMGAEIRVRSIKRRNRGTAPTTLPVDQFTKRQLEVFQLARERGYYEYPKETTAGELADELGITASTLHEHLHKVEAVLLGRDGPTRLE